MECLHFIEMMYIAHLDYVCKVYLCIKFVALDFQVRWRRLVVNTNGVGGMCVMWASPMMLVPYLLPFRYLFVDVASDTSL